MNSNLFLCLALVLGGLFSHSGHAAILFPKAPEEGRQIASKNVSDLLLEDSNVLNGLQMKDLTITNCHPLYEVRPADIVSGKLLSASKMAAWTYPFVHKSYLVAYVTLNVNPTNGSIIPSSGVGVGSPSNRVMEGLRIATQLPQVKKDNYEFRTLQCYSIQFFAAWLHGKSKDIIIPLPSTYGRCNAYQPYSGSEIAKLLKPDAEKALQWTEIERVVCSALEHYNRVHGLKCGTVNYVEIGRAKTVGPGVWMCNLRGEFSECGILDYKAKITFTDETWSVVKQVEILKKITDNKP